MQQGTGCGGPTEGLGSPTGGLNDSTEDTFLRNRTQFCIKKSPTGIKLFPIGGGTNVPRRKDSTPSGATPGYIIETEQTKSSKLAVIEQGL